VRADQGDVERLEALEGFKRITAYFDGIVTARETDIGAKPLSENSQPEGSGSAGRQPPRPLPAHQIEMALGSGFFISPDGYAVTNNHVVQRGVSFKIAAGKVKTTLFATRR
jgi:S1-C subfamily serine protease